MSDHEPVEASHRHGGRRRVLPSRPPADDALLDTDILDGLRQLGDDSLGTGLSELIELFLSESEASLSELHVAVSQGDDAVVRRLAHALYGSTANFGARRVPALLSTLEHAAVSDQLEVAAPLLEALDLEWASYRRALREVFPPDGQSHRAT